MAKTVTFEIDTDLCELTVDSGTLFLGEQAPIVFAGYTPASGNTLFLSLFDKDHVTPLADNATSANTLDLRYEAMRDAFGDCKAAHSFYATVIERTSGGSWVGQVLAAGHVRVEWSPVVFDAVSGDPATLRGPAGQNGQNGTNGTNGADGEDGEDGISPHVGDNGNWFVGSVDTGVKAQGPQGLQGQQGAAGQNGQNGTNGTNGADGVSPAVRVTDVTGGHKVSITDATGTKEFTVLNGSTGAQGPQGVQGVQGLPGIKGEKGDKGDSGSSHWADIEDKPDSFPPEEHQHTDLEDLIGQNAEDIGDLQEGMNLKLDTNEKGSSNGVAELDSSGKVPSSQLPSYVDDVLEYDSASAFPATGESGKIYIAKDTNKQYRWSGSQYVEISSSIALGETSSTAYRGDRGKTAYDHSQSASVHVTSEQKTLWTNKQDALSDAQLDAANSGITAQKLTDLEKRGYFAVDEHGNIYAVIPDQD